MGKGTEFLLVVLICIKAWVNSTQGRYTFISTCTDSCNYKLICLLRIINSVISSPVYTGNATKVSLPSPPVPGSPKRCQHMELTLVQNIEIYANTTLSGTDLFPSAVTSHQQKRQYKLKCSYGSKWRIQNDCPLYFLPLWSHNS